LREHNSLTINNVDIALETLLPGVGGHSETGRLLAGLACYDLAQDDLDILDVEGVLAELSTKFLNGKAALQQWRLLISQKAFSSALGIAARDTLLEMRVEHALSWFDERTVARDDAVTFGRRVEAESKRREEFALSRLLQNGVTLDDEYVQIYRKRMLWSFAWEKSVRALPAAFLLVAAAMAMTMLLRVLKLPQ
jgi:hypothetical protein